MGPRLMSDANRTGMKVLLILDPIVVIIVAIAGVWFAVLLGVMGFAMAAANLYRDGLARRES
jgi:hypothetical protein